MNDWDFREVIDADESQDVKKEENQKESTKESAKESLTENMPIRMQSSDDDTALSKTDPDDAEGPDADVEDDSVEKVCGMCHRPASKVGRIFHVPGGMDLCDDCLQKSFDMVGSMDLGPLGGMFPDPGTGGGFPRITFMDMRNQPQMGTGKKKPKKKKKEQEEKLDLNKIPAPHKIREMLDEYVIGQDYAKKAISVAVYNHYKRVATNTMDEIEIEKSNMLMIGPSGSGKTYLVRTLARILNVPLAITDATSLTEAGYIGDDIESVVTKLLAEADGDVEKAQQGIIFIDEIDKIAKKHNANSRDVSGESVQQGMLKLLEGSEVEVPVGANSKNAMVPLVTVDTRNILFICGGAFPDLNDIIKERLSKSNSIGFNALLQDRFNEEKNLQKHATVEDLRKFGMIPEFIGRLPIIVPLDELSEDMLVEILKEPRNAILKQYQKLLELDEVQLLFDEESYHAIALKAMGRDTGARGLRAVIEEFMLDIMYEIPKDDNIGRVTITADYINGTGGPIIEMRGVTALLEDKVDHQ